MVRPEMKIPLCLPSMTLQSVKEISMRWKARIKKPVAWQWVFSLHHAQNIHEAYPISYPTDNGDWGLST